MGSPAVDAARIVHDMLNGDESRIYLFRDDEYAAAVSAEVRRLLGGLVPPTGDAQVAR